jgi:hypothetical protein
MNRKEIEEKYLPEEYHNLNVKEKYKVKVPVICENCDNKFYLTFKTLMYPTTSELLCKECRSEESSIINKEYRNNLPKEVKKKISEKLSKSSKNYWDNISKKERNKRSEKKKKQWYIKPQEEKEIHNTKLDKERKKYRNNLSLKEKIKLNNKISITQKKNWNKKSLEEQESIKKLLSQYHWNNLDNKEQNRITNIKKDYFKNMTEEERKLHSKYSSEGSKKFWDNITEEEFDIWDNKRRIGYNNYLNNININPNKNESDFINELNKYYIYYQWQYENSTVDKDFDILFPYNYVTGSKFVSKYHAWDFIIFTNRGNILVDIDGSIHDESKIDYYVTDNYGRRYKQIDQIKFYDSQ